MLARASASAEFGDEWVEPDLADLVIVCTRHHPRDAQVQFVGTVRRLSEGRSALDRLLQTVSPTAAQDPIFQITEMGQVLPPKRLWELDDGLSLLAEFATSSRFDVSDPEDATALNYDLWRADLEPEHVATLAAYFCEHEATAELRSLCSLSDAGELKVSPWDLQEGIRDVGRSLDALDIWCRRGLQECADAALLRTCAARAKEEKALAGIRTLNDKEQQRQKKMHEARARYVPTSKRDAIVAAWKKRVDSGEPERQIAAKVAKQCSCTSTYARRVAKSANLKQ